MRSLLLSILLLSCSGCTVSNDPPITINISSLTDGHYQILNKELHYLDSDCCSIFYRSLGGRIIDLPDGQYVKKGETFYPVKYTWEAKLGKMEKE